MATSDLVKLYRSKDHPGYWIGEDPQDNAVLWIWPAEDGGWLSDDRKAWTGGRRGLEVAMPAEAKGTKWPGGGVGRRPRAGGVPSKARAIRATDEEWDEWTAAAGDRSVSDWLRELANAAAAAKKKRERGSR